VESAEGERGPRGGECRKGAAQTLGGGVPLCWAAQSRSGIATSAVVRRGGGGGGGHERKGGRAGRSERGGPAGERGEGVKRARRGLHRGLQRRLQQVAAGCSGLQRVAAGCSRLPAGREHRRAEAPRRGQRRRVGRRAGGEVLALEEHRTDEARHAYLVASGERSSRGALKRASLIECRLGLRGVSFERRTRSEVGGCWAAQVVLRGVSGRALSPQESRAGRCGAVLAKGTEGGGIPNQRARRTGPSPRGKRAAAPRMSSRGRPAAAAAARAAAPRTAAATAGGAPRRRGWHKPRRSGPAARAARLHRVHVQHVHVHARASLPLKASEGVSSGGRREAKVRRRNAPEKMRRQARSDCSLRAGSAGGCVAISRRNSLSSGSSRASIAPPSAPSATPATPPAPPAAPPVAVTGVAVSAASAARRATSAACSTAAGSTEKASSATCGDNSR
jgi:hypothetical protein